MDMPEKIGFTVRTQVAKPIAEVFQAIVDPRIMTKFFAHRASGPIEPGAQLVWTWDQHGDNQVRVLAVEEPHHLKLTWKAYGGADYETIFTFNLEALSADKTMVIVSEDGWRGDQPGVKGALDNAKGWTDMLNCLKAYLEHGIDLRG